MTGASMKECKLCRKLFSTLGGRICQDCYKYLDEIYPTVRSFIRDSNNPQLNVADIADELQLPIKYIQGLVDCGYLNKDLPNAKLEIYNNKDDDKLTKELQKATNELKANASRKQTPLTYGQERYSSGKR